MRVYSLLRGAHAFVPLPAALAELSTEQACTKPGSSPHSIAEIVSHMAFWQRWFLDRATGSPVPMAASAALGWPHVASGQWEAVRDAFEQDYQRALTLADDESRLEQRVLPPIEFGPLERYTIGDALTHVALHNAHHLGQVITLRQQLGAWPPSTGSWTW